MSLENLDNVVEDLEKATVELKSYSESCQELAQLQNEIKTISRSFADHQRAVETKITEVCNSSNEGFEKVDRALTENKKELVHKVNEILSSLKDVIIEYKNQTEQSSQKIDSLIEDLDNKNKKIKRLAFYSLILTVFNLILLGGIYYKVIPYFVV